MPKSLSCSLLWIFLCLSGCKLNPSWMQGKYPRCGPGGACATDCTCLDNAICVPVPEDKGPEFCRTCGNARLDPGEECDDGNGVVTDACPDGLSGSCLTAACGDGFLFLAALGGTEQCDDGNLQPGDGCDATCQFESSDCGDGQKDPAEECDLGSAGNSDTESGACPAVCRTDCRCPHCGDLTVDYIQGEECDDGNASSGDGCGPRCTIEPISTCGDGVLDISRGEQCDDGGRKPGDGCSDTCQFETVGELCGDGPGAGPGEICDDGNTLNGDGCNPTCNLANRVSTWIDFSNFCPRPYSTAVITVTDRDVWIACGGTGTVYRQNVKACDDGVACSPDPVASLPANIHPEEITTDGHTVWVGGSQGLWAFRISDVSSADPLAMGPQHLVAGGTACPNCTACGLAGGILVPGCPADQVEIGDIRGVTYHDGYVYFLDAVLNLLLRYDPLAEWVTVLAGDFVHPAAHLDGYGTAARLQSPRYMTSDNSGMLYIADNLGCAIRSYNTRTGYLGTFAGHGPQPCTYLDGTGPAAGIFRPRGMTSDGTSLYWAETDAHTIRQGVLANREVSTLAGDPCSPVGACPGLVDDTGSAARFDMPFDIVFHYPSNSLFVYDANNIAIRRIQ